MSEFHLLFIIFTNSEKQSTCINLLLKDFSVQLKYISLYDIYVESKMMTVVSAVNRIMATKLVSSKLGRSFNLMFDITSHLLSNLKHLDNIYLHSLFYRVRLSQLVPTDR